MQDFWKKGNSPGNSLIYMGVAVISGFLYNRLTCSNGCGRGWTARVGVSPSTPERVELISGTPYTILIDSNAKMRGWTWRVAVGPRKSIEKRWPIGRNCHLIGENRSKP